MQFLRFLCFIAAIGVASAEVARARYLVISGGGSPRNNHYSQYLQTRSLVEGLRERFDADSVSVAFGAGNRPDRAAEIADVTTLESAIHSGQTFEIRKYLPGEIEGNREASRDGIRRMIESQASRSGPLFLFVSDHGTPNPAETDAEGENNCITLWSAEPKTLELRSAGESCYSRIDLESDLGRLGRRRMVYGMSQCYSGGFHRLSLKKGGDGRISVNPDVCGFASTTEYLTASGCMDKVEGEKYQGYERYFTRHVLGRDFVSGADTGNGPAMNLREAHERALLDDFTGDVPNSSSDAYLWEVFRSLGERGSNRNFAPGQSRRKIRKLVDFFSHPANIGHLPGGPQRTQDAKLHQARKDLLLKWIQISKNRAEISDHLNPEELLSLSLSKLGAVLDYHGAVLFSIGIQGSAIQQDLSALEDRLFNKSELAQAAERSVLDELGLRPLFAAHGETFARLAPRISLVHPEHSASLGLFLPLKRQRVTEALAASPSESSVLERQRRLSARLLEIDRNYRALEVLHRWILQLFMQRASLGVLGAAIQSHSRELLDNYSALRSCEETPL